MSTPPKKGKQEAKPSADSGKVTRILVEARQVVDDLGGGTAAAPARQKKSATPAMAGPRSRSSAGTAKQPASRSKAAAAAKAATPRKPRPSPGKVKKTEEAAAKPASPPPSAPLLSPQECGISVLHSLPGRIRFRIKSLQYDDDFARELEARLSAIKGISEVGASPATGSLLITYLSKEEVALPLGKALQTWFPRLDSESLLALLQV